MAEPTRERPAIHVCLCGSVDPELYRWVAIGAEEEGLPTRSVDLVAGDVVATAYVAAQSSRFDIGVAIGQGFVVLHEAHMPAAQPVLAFPLDADAPHACRLMGGNAARLVVRLPLRFADDGRGEASAPHSPALPISSDADASPLEVQVTNIVSIITRILKERGIA